MPISPLARSRTCATIGSVIAGTSPSTAETAAGASDPPIERADAKPGVEATTPAAATTTDPRVMNDRRLSAFRRAFSSDVASCDPIRALLVSDMRVFAHESRWMRKSWRPRQDSNPSSRRYELPRRPPCSAAKVERASFSGSASDRWRPAESMADSQVPWSAYKERLRGRTSAPSSAKEEPRDDGEQDGSVARVTKKVHQLRFTPTRDASRRTPHACRGGDAPDHRAQGRRRVVDRDVVVASRLYQPGLDARRVS